MSIAIRLLLIVGALLAFWLVANQIRHKRVLMGDAIFWVVLSLVLVVIALFPQIAFFFSDLLGFVSPSNFVLLLLVALLMAKMFANSSEISMLKHRVNELAQENALLRKEHNEQ